MLYVLDTEGHTAIAVMPIPDEGLGRAINDLLKLAGRRLEAQARRVKAYRRSSSRPRLSKLPLRL